MGDDKDIQEIVEALQAPETFDFIAVLNGRDYPTDEVTIYLDEATAYAIGELSASKLRLTEEADMDVADKQLADLKTKLLKSAYVFKLTGISLELRELLSESAKAKFKSEYETSRNFVTGQVEKFEKPNPERNQFLGLSVFQAHVEQIVSPDGKVITAPEVGIIDAFLKKAPESQVEKFIIAVNKLQVASQAFETATDEDFLAKS